MDSVICKDYPLIHYKESIPDGLSISLSDQYGKTKANEGVNLFKRNIHGNKHLVIRIQLIFLIKKELHDGNTFIHIIQENNAKTYEYPLRVTKPQNDGEWI